MSKRPLASIIAILLTVSFAAPTAFFIAPQRVQAQVPVVVTGDIVGWIQETITAVSTAISAIAEPVTAAAEVANDINTFVLQPLAFILSGNLMKALTSSVIGFVIGKANGTGVPQFVVDVKRSLQTVADSQALAYLKQVRTTNSPFAGSISSALRTDYLSKTSLAGFWAANMNTLERSSPDVPAYLNGNWSQGGVVAWFALTTQTQNNPYELYNHTRDQLAAVVGRGAGGATDVRLADINRSGGFMSWCGTSDATTEASNASIAASQNMAGMAPKPDPKGTFYGAMGDTYLTQADATAADAANGAASTLANLGSGRTAEGFEGINPGDPCSNKDGTPGIIKTPGSVIKSTLDKVLGGQQDQILRMGNVGGQIADILRKIGNIVNTVQFASSLLGGKDSGGLFGVNSPSSSNQTSRLEEFQPTYDTAGNFTSGYAGATQTSVYQAAAAKGSSGGDKLKLIAGYEGAWETIGASADTASTKLDSLASFCTAAADKAALAGTINEFGGQTTPTTDLSTVHSGFIDAARAQAAEARSIITTTIASVLAQAKGASIVVTKANAMVQKVQDQLRKAPTETTASTYSADVLELQSMPPSESDFANVMQQSQVFGQATASPEGSLNVSGVSLADKMSLLGTNADALKISVCTPGGGNQVIN